MRIQRGDVNGDGTVDQKDVIIGLSVLAGSNPIGVTTAGDVNADNKIGMEDILHDLNRIVEEQAFAQVHSLSIGMNQQQNRR